jgi:hypothetical protein
METTDLLKWCSDNGLKKLITKATILDAKKIEQYRIATKSEIKKLTDQICKN